MLGIRHIDEAAGAGAGSGSGVRRGEPGPSTAASLVEAARRSLLDLTHDVVLTLDHAGIVRYVSAAWQQQLGHLEADTLGRPITDFMTADGRARLRGITRRLLSHGELRDEEIGFLAHDGSRHGYRWNVRHDRTRRYVYGAARQLGENGARDPGTTTREAIYEAVFTASIDGILIGSGDGEGPVFEANPAMIAMLRGTPAPFNRRSVLDPDDARLRAALVEREATGHFLGELEFHRVDGTTFPGEVSSAIFAGTDGLRHTVTIVRDLSETERAGRVLEATERSLELQAAALRETHAGVVITDANGTISWVNPAFTRITGYTASEAVGKRASLLKSGVHGQDFYAEVWATITSGLPWRGEFTNRRKDGTIYYEDQIITPVRGSDGEIRNFVAIKHDVTERKRDLQRLRASEASFRQLFSHNPHAMFVYERQSLAILAANAAAVDQYGYSETEFLGMTILGLRLEEDADALLQYLAEKAHPLANSGVWKHVAKSGKVIHVDVSAHDLRFQGKDATLVVAHDVSDWITSKNALVESERRYRMLADNATDMVVRRRVRPQLAFEYVSPSATALSGYAPEEYYENPLLAFDLIHPDDAHMFREGPEQTAPYVRTPRWIRKDGRVVHVEVHNRPILGADGKVDAIEGIARDVTARVESERQVADLNARLKTKLRQLHALHRIDTKVILGHSLDDILDTALAEVRNELPFDAAAIYTLDHDGQTLSAVKTYGEALQLDAIAAGVGAAGAAVQRGVPILVRDTQDASQAHGFEMLHAPGMRGRLALPLLHPERLMGVLAFFTRAPLDPSEDAFAFADTISRQVAIALRHQQLNADLKAANASLEAAYDRTIEGWSQALDLRDRTTAGHTQRVADLTVELATRLGLSDEECVHIRRGALLHDIGKMGVSDDILLKPGHVTPEEYEAIKKHPALAYDMLKDISLLAPALVIPRDHHERWDGSGYPEGLLGTTIPLAARIFAVVDVYDAITHNRPYHEAQTPEAALQHLRAAAGRLYDPDVVDAIAKLLEQPHAADAIARS